MARKKKFNRSAEDLGNIVELEHVNVTIPDQTLATLRTTTCEDVATTLGGHAGSESVAALPLDAGRLVGALHVCLQGAASGALAARGEAYVLRLGARFCTRNPRLLSHDPHRVNHATDDRRCRPGQTHPSIETIVALRAHPHDSSTQSGCARRAPSSTARFGARTARIRNWRWGGRRWRWWSMSSASPTAGARGSR